MIKERGFNFDLLHLMHGVVCSHLFLKHGLVIFFLSNWWVARENIRFTWLLIQRWRSYLRWCLPKYSQRRLSDLTLVACVNCTYMYVVGMSLNPKCACWATRLPQHSIQAAMITRSRKIMIIVSNKVTSKIESWSIIRTTIALTSGRGGLARTIPLALIYRFLNCQKQVEPQSTKFCSSSRSLS